MSWVAVAIGGSAVIGAGVGLYSANKASDAQTQANQQALAANQQALAYQKETDARNQANMAPYLGLGSSAATKLGGIYGEGGITGAGWQDFLNSPDYQFAFGEGRRALENSAASRGGLLGGNFARGITQFGQGMASQQFGNYYNRILGQAQLGQNAAAGAGSLGNQSAGQVGQTSGQIGQNFQGIGQAQASGYVGGANAVTGSLQSGVQNYLFNNAMNKSSYAPNASAFDTSALGMGWG